LRGDIPSVDPRDVPGLGYQGDHSLAQAFAPVARRHGPSKLAVPPDHDRPDIFTTLLGHEHLTERI
jgi:hypothetical protein